MTHIDGCVVKKARRMRISLPAAKPDIKSTGTRVLNASENYQ